MKSESKRDVFAEPTVLVLGAGASQPYGFPLGADLKELVLTEMRGLTATELKTTGGNRDVVDELGEALQHSLHETIDRLLEIKTNCRELGAYLIARVIARHEKETALFQKRDWHGELFVALDFDSGDSRSASHLSIVTLNYDRSIEHFLKESIYHNCNREHFAAAHRKREAITILHPHGSLGKYPDVQYGIDVSNNSALRAAAQSIRIPGDQLDDSEEFKAAQMIIAGAANVVFLGFGYDQRTLNRLMGKSRNKRQSFYGTGFNLPADTRASVEGIFHGTALELGRDTDTAVTFFQKLVKTDWGRLGPVCDLRT
jgi:hypothetical protein